MRRYAGVILCLLAFVVPGVDAASSKISTTFRDPETQSLKFTKVAVAVLSPDLDLRRRAEGGLARRMKNGVAVSTLLTDEETGDRAAAKAKLAQAGFDGALVIQPLGTETSATVQHGESYAFANTTFWDYWETTWHVVTLPGYVNIDKVVTIDIAIYSMSSEKVVWAGRMTATDPKSLRTFLDDLVKIGADELRKQKLI